MHLFFLALLAINFVSAAIHNGYPTKAPTSQPTQPQPTVVITESLINGFSEYQVDLTGYRPPAYHPTGFSIETVFNPFALGTTAPNPFPCNNGQFSGINGQNTGMCISLTDDLSGQWWCSLAFVFYANSSGVCIPPNEYCQNTGLVTGSIAYQGVFPAVSSVQLNFTTLAVVGGTGTYAGANGYIVATQDPSYAFFTYYVYLL